MKERAQSTEHAHAQAGIGAGGAAGFRTLLLCLLWLLGESGFMRKEGSRKTSPGGLLKKRFPGEDQLLLLLPESPEDWSEAGPALLGSVGCQPGCGAWFCKEQGSWAFKNETLVFRFRMRFVVLFSSP